MLREDLFRQLTLEEDLKAETKSDIQKSHRRISQAGVENKCKGPGAGKSLWIRKDSVAEAQKAGEKEGAEK